MNNGIIKSQDPFKRPKGKNDPIVYVPKDAGTNTGIHELGPPMTEYRLRQMFFNPDAVKKLIGGIYGRGNSK